MSIDLDNEYVQSLIKEYRKALKRYWAACEDTLKNIEESSDYNIVIEMMYDAICYKDDQMQAKILYKRFNEKKKEKYDIEQCKLWHEKLPKEECKDCDCMECENKKEANQA